MKLKRWLLTASCISLSGIATNATTLEEFLQLLPPDIPDESFAPVEYGETLGALDTLCINLDSEGRCGVIRQHVREGSGWSMTTYLALDLDSDRYLIMSIQEDLQDVDGSACWNTYSPLDDYHVLGISDEPRISGTMLPVSPEDATRYANWLMDGDAEPHQNPVSCSLISVKHVGEPTLAFMASNWNRSGTVPISIHKSPQELLLRPLPAPFQPMSTAATTGWEGASLCDRNDRQACVLLNAESIATDIENAGDRNVALGVIARGWASLGQFSEAERLAEGIDDGIWRSAALQAIAVMQAEAGQVSAAERTARGMGSGGGRDSVLVAVLGAQADAGQFRDAEQTMRTIQDDRSRQRAVGRLALARATAGQFIEAERLAGSIEDAGWRANALMEVARAHADAHHFADAERIVDGIGDAATWMQASIAIADIRVRAGQIQEASRLWAEVEHVIRANGSENGWSAGVLLEIVKARAEAGQFLHSTRMANEFKDDWARVAALSTIAKAHAGAGLTTEAFGLWSEAQRIAQQVDDVATRASALNKVAETLASAALLTEAAQVWVAAEQAAGGIEDIDRRENVLTGMAEAQAKAGNFSEAERIARGIEGKVNRVAALTRIAIHF